MIKFIRKLLSNSDDISSNRFIGVISFIILISIIIYSILKGQKVNVEIFKESLLYLTIIILSALGFKDGIKAINNIKKKNKEDD